MLRFAAYPKDRARITRCEVGERHPCDKERVIERTGGSNNVCKKKLELVEC